MKGRELTRRQILAGAAGAGGTGILVGTGTAAYLADDEVFGNALVVGTVDLGVDLGSGTRAVEIDTAEGSETLTVALDSLEETDNNPAYVWLRLACPGGTDLDCDLEVRLSYDCGGGSTQRIAPDDGRDFAPLLEVANELRAGIPLAPTCSSTTPSCLQPGQTIELLFEWRLTEDYDGGETNLGGDSDLFQFEAEQCRYNSGTNPFDVPDTDCGACVQEVSDQAVSWFACCVEDDGNGAHEPGVDLADTQLSQSGTAVEWDTENPVDYVVLKTGIGGDNEPYVVYDYRGKSKTSGVARVGDDNADYRGDRNADGYHDGCPDTGAPPDSCPGQYAKDVVYDGAEDPFSGEATKLDKGEL